MARVKRRVSRKDYPDQNILKGETYYSWQLYKGPLIRSKTYPRRSQLTGSYFLQRVYDLMDLDLPAVKTADELRDIANEISSLGEEMEDSLNNMPEQLQNAPTGEQLATRVQNCSDFANEIESIADELENNESEDALTDAIDAVSSVEPDWE